MTSIYKKGNVELPENYRPISLLSLGYKIFAALVGKRLLDAGVEQRPSKYQLSFRSGRSTQDAICILRRRIEQEWASKHGNGYFLALDWKQAFDSVNTEAMIAALKRFGLPSFIRRIVGDIYNGRTFQVRDAGHLSAERAQGSGISQGCPQSPLLFVMVMTVIMTDAAEALGQQLAERVGQLVYADDTLLIARRADDMQERLRVVQEAASLVGLELHWGNLHLMRVRCCGEVKTLIGDAISATDTISYLGTTVSSDGRMGSELNRRLGMASAEFYRIKRVWGHTSIGEQQKIALFNTIIIPKLLYSLSTVCLNAAERRRLDGAHCRMLRGLCGVKHPMISRVSNTSIRARTRQEPLTNTLLKQQLLLFGKAAGAESGDPLRESIFVPGTLTFITDHFVRKAGRPRLEWAKSVLPHARQLSGEHRRWEDLVQDECGWRRHVAALR